MEKIRKMIGCLTAVCLLLAVAAFFLPGAVRAGYRGGRRCGRAVCGRLRAAPDEGRGRGIKNRKTGSPPFGGLCV